MITVTCIRTRCNLFAYGWIVATVALMASFGTHADAAVIQFHTIARVESSIVQLGDVARVVDADAAVVHQLQQIPIAPAPAPGSHTHLAFSSIRARLRAQGVNLDLLEFQGNSRIQVLRIAEDESAVNVSAGAVPEESARIETTSAAADTPVRPVVYAARYDLPSGHRLSTDDVVLQEAATAAGTLERLEDVVGKETRTPLRAGRPIRIGDVRDVPLVRSGELVTVLARRGSVTVRRQMKSRNTAAKGESITLVAVDGRQKLSAVVTGFREAEVVTAGGSRFDEGRDLVSPIRFHEPGDTSSRQGFGGAPKILEAAPKPAF